MSRVLAVALVSLTLQMAAWADGIKLVNKFGTITISNAGIASKGSELSQFNSLTAGKGNSLGSMSFATGALLTGSVLTGGTFSSVGSRFTAMGVGNAGQPKGVIFNGAFVGSILWTLVSQHGASLVFELSGQLSGRTQNGATISGQTTQTFYTTKAQLAKGIVHILSGNTNLYGVPEPGTLSLLATGLLGIGLAVHRNLAVKSAS